MIQAEGSPLIGSPRAGGEHAALRSKYVGGSSPRRRGTQPGLVAVIPAQAGNTVTSRNSVHPRAGGEHNAVIVSLLSSGSSSAARGTLASAITRHDRFIPAQAGNTSA